MKKGKCPYCSNEVDVEELLSVDILELLEDFKQIEKYSTNCPYCDRYVRVDVKYEVSFKVGSEESFNIVLRYMLKKAYCDEGEEYKYNRLLGLSKKLKESDEKLKYNKEKEI